MTKQEAAIVETYTGFVMLTGDDRKYVYEYASQLIGRPIFTHEFLIFAQELEEKSKSDFIKICKDLKIDERDKQIENLKRLLKLAIDDIARYCCDVCKYRNIDAYLCPCNDCFCVDAFEWRFEDEVKELLKDVYSVSD